MTYSELKGVVPFDWNEFLAKEEYNKNELIGIGTRASRWVTCAVGNQCNIIKRNKFGEPLDLELAILGFYFTNVINGMISNSKYFDNNKRYYDENKADAIFTLKRIEERSALIIQKLTNNPNV